MTAVLPPLLAKLSGLDLALELVDASTLPLVRLYRFPGGDWEPVDTKYRNLRVDPPDGCKDDFAVLYVADTLLTVAVECGVVRVDHVNRAVWCSDLAQQYRVVRYEHDKPALFIPIDGPNRKYLGLGTDLAEFGSYAPYQRAAKVLHQRYGGIVHGLSWASFHRNQPGRVYALWHEHKGTIGLKKTSAEPHGLLIDDDEWKELLALNPAFEEVTVGGVAPPPAKAARKRAKGK
jgi:hypothetical protein